MVCSMASTCITNLIYEFENNLVLYINTKKYKYIRTNTKYIVFEYVKTVQWQNFNWLNN